MKKLYQLPEAELMLLDVTDILTASVGLESIKMESGAGDSVTWASGLWRA